MAAGAMERDEVGIVYGLGGELEGGLDILGGELRIRVEELLRRVAIRNAANHDAYGHARPRDARLAVMDGRIDYDSIAPVLLHVVSTETSRTFL